MAQHDYVIANQSGSSFRSDLNNALSAIVSNNSGSSEPTTTYAYQWWADTTNGQLKLRNAANSAWITIQELDGTMLMENGTAAAPGLAFASDLNTGFYRIGADQLGIATNGTAAVAVDASQRVGIGSTAVEARFHVSDTDSSSAYSTGSILGTQTSIYKQIIHTNQSTGTNEAGIVLRAGESPNIAEWGVSVQRTGATSGDLIFRNRTGASSSAERFRCDSSGRLLVGTSSARANFFNSTFSPLVQLEGANNDGARLQSFTYGRAGSSDGPIFVLAKCRDNSVGGNTTVASGDQLGWLSFQGNDGTEFVEGASIRAEVDSTPGANDMPGRLVFSTTADGASSPTERMRIQSTGTVLINKTSSSFATSGFEYRSSNELTLTSTTTNISLNRLSTDGDLIDFFQDTIKEGSISVSGTTVSYNGAHLSRWSQLPNGAERTEILRGSVLSNIDEMCEWGEEDNEQLNRMKVSDVEGDKNVSGVFQAWDDDDDTYTNDFYCAMTGDFIIRIAGDVTVERGDLLMSAGDGTAKPQDDDIIRSKTIAKVTSTNVSCTYEDGSYCVPCVLMAC